MAISFVKKAAAGTATAEKEKAVTTAKKKPGQAKKLPIDGLNFNQPQRLRVGHLLTLLQISAPQLYKMRAAGKLPEPAGHFGTGTRPTPYWLTTQMLPYITGGSKQWISQPQSLFAAYRERSWHAFAINCWKAAA